jgi:hypothetical protein
MTTILRDGNVVIVLTFLHLARERSKLLIDTGNSVDCASEPLNNNTGEAQLRGRSNGVVAVVGVCICIQSLTQH